MLTDENEHAVDVNVLAVAEVVSNVVCEPVVTVTAFAHWSLTGALTGDVTSTLPTHAMMALPAELSPAARM